LVNDEKDDNQGFENQKKFLIQMTSRSLPLST